MGLTGSALNSFRDRIDETLRDAFPATLIVDGVEILASGPGGRVGSDFVDAGEAEHFRFPFRITKAALAIRPEMGSAMDWKVNDTLTIPMEVCESPIRPHESVWSVTCKKRRMP